MSIPRTVTLFAAGAMALAAQQGTVGGPISGYAFDGRARSLRTIRGIPGASLVGEAVDFGSPLAAAWVSPNLDSALIWSIDGAARLYRLDAGKATHRPIDGLTAPARALYSPSGTALALFVAGSVRIYSGLPDAPALAGTIDLPGETRVVRGGQTLAKVRRPAGNDAALSDDGRYLLYVSGDAAELLGVAGDSRRLTPAHAGTQLAFAAGSHDAAVIDAQAITLFQDAAGAATIRRLPGVTGARAASFSTDGKRLFLAGDAVTVLDLADGQRTDLPCDCRPAELSRMGATFRLNEIGSGPIWLLDAAASPKVLFVPAAQ
jgi:hypothetical protein